MFQPYCYRSLNIAKSRLVCSCARPFLSIELESPIHLNCAGKQATLKNLESYFCCLPSIFNNPPLKVALCLVLQRNGSFRSSTSFIA